MFCENVPRRLGIAWGTEPTRGVLAHKRLGAANFGDLTAARAALGRVLFRHHDDLLPEHERLVLELGPEAIVRPPEKRGSKLTRVLANTK